MFLLKYLEVFFRGGRKGMENGRQTGNGKRAADREQENGRQTGNWKTGGRQGIGKRATEDGRPKFITFSVARNLQQQADRPQLYASSTCYYQS
ncbi:MAG: hypothetical protein FWG68_11425 [Defluviitaleaceae bacterium]|nr:hypothetical protein [Defluviitaleaceae bacterium]